METAGLYWRLQNSSLQYDASLHQKQSELTTLHTIDNRERIININYKRSYSHFSCTNFDIFIYFLQNCFFSILILIKNKNIKIYSISLKATQNTSLEMISSVFSGVIVWNCRSECLPSLTTWQARPRWTRANWSSPSTASWRSSDRRSSGGGEVGLNIFCILKIF